MPLTIIKERAPENTPLLSEDETIKLVAPNVSSFFGDKPQGTGTLYVTTRNVIWLPALPQNGFSVDFHFISIHAVSRDTSSFSSPCLYCQLDIEESETNLEEYFNELRFVPPNIQEQLELLYTTFCECAALNPDPESDKDEDGFFWNGDPENDAIADQLEMEHEGMFGGTTQLFQALNEEKDAQYEDADEENMDDE